MPDHRLDRRATTQGTLDGGREPPLLPRHIDPEALLLGCVVALVSGIGDDPLKLRPDRLLKSRDDGCQRVSVIGVARQRLHMGHELPAPAAVERSGYRDLHAELVGLMGLALADALRLRRVQAVDLPAPLTLALILHPAGQRERPGEDALQR